MARLMQPGCLAPGSVRMGGNNAPYKKGGLLTWKDVKHAYHPLGTQCVSQQCVVPKSSAISTLYHRPLREFNLSSDPELGFVGLKHERIPRIKIRRMRRY